MIKLIFICLLLSGCASQPEPKPFVLGDTVQPPMGCIELRKRDPKADC